MWRMVWKKPRLEVTLPGSWVHQTAAGAAASSQPHTWESTCPGQLCYGVALTQAQTVGNSSVEEKTCEKPPGWLAKGCGSAPALGQAWPVPRCPCLASCLAKVGPARSLQTCLAVTRQHPTPIAVPGPTVLPLFRYLRCLPCLALLSPWVPAHPHAGQATPASPRQPESIKMQKTNAFNFWVLIYYLWLSKYTARELIHAQSRKCKKNRGFHLVSICTDNLENCLQYTLHYPKYLKKMRHLEEGLNLRDIPSSSKKTHRG